MQEQEVGRIIHFYTNISVGIIQLSSTLKVGDTIHIKGATTDFTQKVASMQVNHAQVTTANPGESIGLQVRDHVREHDVVYKVTGGGMVSVKPAMPAKAAARKPTAAKKKAIRRTKAKKKVAPARKKAKRAAKKPKKGRKSRPKRRKKRAAKRKSGRKRR